MPLLARNSCADKSEQEHLDRGTDIHCTTSLVSFTTLYPADVVEYLVYKCWLTGCPPYGLPAGGRPKCLASVMSFHTPLLKFKNQSALIQLIVSSLKATSNMFKIYAAILPNLEQNLHVCLQCAIF
jgi:hypothetical protein